LIGTLPVTYYTKQA